MGNEEIAKKINKIIFPGIQGGPLMHVIAAKAQCFSEALQPSFKSYQEQVVKNAKVLANTLMNKGFKIIIMSNAPKYKIEPFKNYLLVDGCAFSLKPKKDKYVKIMEKFKFNNNEIASIGDQLLTDVLGANRMDIKSILVNPLTSKNHTITIFNKIMEIFIYNQLSKKDLLKKGRYYE